MRHKAAGILEYLALGFSAVFLVASSGRSTREVLFSQKTEKLWCSFMPSLCHYVWDRDGALSLTACSSEIKKSASLSNSTAKSRCVKMRWQSGQDSWMSSRSLTLCCLHLCKVDAELYHSWVAFTCLFFSYSSACLPPFLISDVKSRNHFTDLEGDVVHWWMSSSEPV